MNIQEQINQKQADILTAKSYLYETDYHVIKASELKTEMASDITQQRSDARDLIDLRQAEISDLQNRLDTELLSQQDSYLG